MMLLGIRLFSNLKPAPASRAGSTLMIFAGIALALLASTTDPTIRDYPSTWHGRLHDLSFVLLGLTLFPAMIVLGFAFRNDERWNNLSLYTWGAILLAAPAFALKGAAFYVFLFAILVWNEVVAIRLNSHS
jgi:O-antigen/teichoic acid export membrane protein